MYFMSDIPYCFSSRNLTFTLENQYYNCLGYFEPEVYDALFPKYFVAVLHSLNFSCFLEFTETSYYPFSSNRTKKNSFPGKNM